MNDDVLGQVQRQTLALGHRVDDVVVVAHPHALAAALDELARIVDLDEAGLLEHLGGLANARRTQRSGWRSEGRCHASGFAPKHAHETSGTHDQLGVGNAAAAVGQQRQGDDGARGHGGHGVDAGHRAKSHAFGQLSPLPGRGLPVESGLLAISRRLMMSPNCTLSRP